jgi:Zn finger protein HypA/HybF involved in hydrogenase expression
MAKRTRPERMAIYHKHKGNKYLYHNLYYIENIMNVSPDKAKRYNKAPFRCYKCNAKVSDHDHYPSCKKCYDFQTNVDIRQS